MRFFKCSVCNVFFENYLKATVHLGLRHSERLVSSVVGNKTAAATSVRDKTGIGISSLIVPARFPNVYVVLRRELADQVLRTRKSLINKHGTLTSGKKGAERGNVSRSSLGSKNVLKNSKSGSAPVEIKLDNMTASEIEGLIGGLVKKSSHNIKSKPEDTKRRAIQTTNFKSKSSKSPAPKKVAVCTNTCSTFRVATRSSTTTSKPFQSPANQVHKKNYEKSATEIKLDSLKASEIELLMNGLFSSKNKNSSKKSTPVLKADSKKQAAFSREEKVSEVAEVASSPTKGDENSNFRRSARQRKPVSRLVELDDDLIADEWAGVNSDKSDNEDDEYVPELEKKPSKRAEATKRPVNNRSRSSSSDDEQLDTDYELNDEDIPNLKRHDDEDATTCNDSKTEEDSEEELPPLLQRYDESDSQERGEFPKLQPYVRDRRKDKSKPQYKLQCRYCPAQFSAKTWFGNHMREQHANANGKFSCNICPTGKEYTLRFLHKHFRRYHNIKDAEEQKKWEYTCNICGKKNQTLFAHESHERYHKRFMNPQNPFPCPVCPHRFSTKFNLTQHFNIHLENNPFQCTFPGCGKKFAGNYHLKRHYAYHIYRTVYKCQHCAATYTRPHRLENHIRQAHSSAFADPKSKVRQPVRRRKYAIKSLNIGFGSIKDVMTDSQDNQEPECVNLEAATTIKNESEPVVADDSTEDVPQIQGTFSLDISQLPRHSNDVVSSDPVFIKLTQENPELIDQLLPKVYAGNGGVFKCHICGWIGARTYHLQQHLLKEHNKKLEPAITPSEKNPLGLSLFCGTCGFHAGTSEEITEHMISSHPEMNKVQCSYCTLRFRTARKKSEHERKCHFSTPEFSCQKCTMSFVTEKGFKDHMYLKHTNPSVRYTCKTCGKIYHTKPAYCRHMDSHLPPDKRRFASEQQSKCRLCHQVLSTKASLRRHIQYVHLKAKNKWNEAVQRKRQQRKLELLQSTSSTSSRTSSNNPDKPSENTGAVAGTSHDIQEPQPVEEINEILGF